mmetsp:Transcript_50870/g.65138  ORF Transcript_50870/g.65138 Transcript_50870/m.65138 type:complete len:218 (+) Transcript_50870:116-769(+)
MSSHDISRRRVQNGYGIPTSTLSITHLGSEPRLPSAQIPLHEYRSEAITISDQVKQRHGPANASLHMQKNFPETRRLMQPPHGRLSEQQTPRTLKDVSFPPHNNHRTKWERDEKPFAQTNPKWCRDITESRNFSDGHRAQLANRSHKTNVNLIISQQDNNGAPFKAGCDLLFPQNASHMQLLQLTKQVNAPDPRIQPQPQPQKHVWRGMDKGWSNHK